MEVFKIDELSSEQFKALTSFIRDIIYHALDKSELDGVYQAVDLALKQSYRDIGLGKSNAKLSGSSLDSSTAFDNEEADDSDEFSELYTP